MEEEVEEEVSKKKHSFLHLTRIENYFRILGNTTVRLMLFIYKSDRSHQAVASWYWGTGLS